MVVSLSIRLRKMVQGKSLFFNFRTKSLGVVSSRNLIANREIAIIDAKIIHAIANLGDMQNMMIMIKSPQPIKFIPERVLKGRAKGEVEEAR